MVFPRPSIARAFVADAARSTIEIETSEPCTAGGASGLAIATTGTLRTVTGLSGAGQRFSAALSGPIAHLDVVDLLVGPDNEFASLDGHKLGAGAVSVENDVASGPPPSPGPGDLFELGDADVTLLGDGLSWRVIPASTLTADRTITLSATGAKDGEQIAITRLDVSAHAVAIVNAGTGGGTIATMPGGAESYVVAEFNGSDWLLRVVPQAVGGASSTPPEVAFTTRVDLSSSSFMVYAGSAAIVWVLAPTTRVAGAQCIASVPAGTAPSWTFPGTNVAQRGDAFDAASDMLVIFETMPDLSVLATTRARTVPDAVAPTISSAVVSNADPTHVTITATKALDWLDQSHVSLVYTAGTPKTIVSVSGIDTTTPVVALSAPTLPGDAFSMVWAAGHTYQDLNGNRLAAVTKAVTNNVIAGVLATPNLYEYWTTGAGITQSVGDAGGRPGVQTCSAWLGRKAGISFAQASGALQPSVEVNNFGDGATDLLFNSPGNLLNTAVNADLSDTQVATFFMALRANYAGGTMLFEHGAGFSTDTPGIALVDNGTGFVLDVQSGVGLDTWTAATGIGQASVWHYLEVTIDFSQASGSQLHGLVDATNPAGSATASVANTGNLGNKVLHLGARFNAGAGSAFTIMRLAALGIIKGTPSAGDRAALRAALRAEFPALV